MIPNRLTMAQVLATCLLVLTFQTMTFAQATQPGREFERPPHLPIGLDRTVKFLPDGRPHFQVPRVPMDPKLPTLWLIGDSTVRNGSYEDGDNGQWGWGNPIRFYFDESKVNVQNRAVGGTTSLSFQEQHWKWIMEELKPGDFLIMQFGHNDGSTPKGNDDDTHPVAGRQLHTFGWYLRKYVTDAQSKGLKDIVICSPIPRNNWRDGKINPDGWTATCKEAAETSNAKFVDLNGLILGKYMALGQEKVTELYFPEPRPGRGGNLSPETTHPSWAGAVLNAECVIDGLKGINSPVVQYLKPEAPKGLSNQWGKAR